jgi:hypothetical protein
MTKTLKAILAEKFNEPEKVGTMQVTDMVLREVKAVEQEFYTANDFEDSVSWNEFVNMVIAPDYTAPEAGVMVTPLYKIEG